MQGGEVSLPAIRFSMGDANDKGKTQSKSARSELSSLIEMMAKALVDFPDQVQVNEIVGENTTVIELKVAQGDLGKIIGKQGRTAQAIRTILTGASTKLKKRTVLEIVE